MSDSPKDIASCALFQNIDRATIDTILTTAETNQFPALYKLIEKVS